MILNRLLIASISLAIAGTGLLKAQGDVTPPAVVSHSPSSGAIAQSVGIAVTATFSEPVQPDSISFVLRDSTNIIVPSSIGYNASTQTVTLTPSAALSFPRTYTASLSAAADLAGNGLSAPAVWSFSTIAPGFQEAVIFNWLDHPTAFQFAPDGRVFVAEKSGLIKVFTSLSETTPIVFADLRTQVNSFGNRGLLGLAIDPAFPASPYIYVFYTHDAPIGGTAPVWSDTCPDPTGSGCVVSGRISRLTANGNIATGEQVLIEDWYQRYPGQSVGNLAFGADGALYASAGDGANSIAVDLGQTDPTSPDPVNEGGALRSQDLRTPADPVTLDGAVIRIQPATGNPVRTTTSMTVGEPTVDVNGVKSYAVVSTFQGPAPMTVRVLEPTNPAPGHPHRILYVLPVDSGVTSLASTYSDGLEELRLLDVPNRFNFTLIAPSFNYEPWYGDHATDQTHWMESYIIRDLVPFGDSFASPGEIPQRFLIGFSKSGNGVLALILRHPNIFTAAAAWDAPVEFTDMSAFPGMVLNFGTEQNFDLYEIPALVSANKAAFTQSNRLWISGDVSAWTSQMAQLHSQLQAASIPHTWVQGGFRQHGWNTGWLDGAVTALDATPAAPIDTNEQRIIAYGLRSPRLAFRPGTQELWVADKGGNSTEEINRIPNATDGVIENFGWPCYEGAAITGYSSTAICGLLYSQTGVTNAPYFSYDHQQKVVPGDEPTGDGSISGLAFYDTGAYPANYQGALFFSDAVRNQIWIMPKGGDGLPDPASRSTFLLGAANPVDLKTGPGGDLFYADGNGGTIRRITYMPPLVRSGGQPSGPLPAGTTFTTLSLTTSENATCRYSAIPGVAFASMTNLFSVTGGTAQSTVVTGLSNGVNYNLYVRCQNAIGYVNPDDYTISFSVAQPGDTTPPVLSNGQPTGTLPAGTTQATLSLNTNENTLCRYASTPGISYASMPNAFATTGGAAHAALLTGLVNGATYSYYARCVDTAGNTNTADFTINFAVDRTFLTGAIATPSGTQNLTTMGSLDWAHWGRTTAASYDHKANVTPQISNFTLLGNIAPTRYTNHPFGFTWSDGTPAASATTDTTGVFTSGLNNGFQITVPADATQRTLILFVGSWNAQGKLVAHLSDGSAPDYTDISLYSPNNAVAGVYTLAYKAASANQTLTITFTQNDAGDGNISLQAAALRTDGPDFSMTVVPAAQAIAQGASATYTLTVAAVGGFSGSVALAANGLPAGASASFNPPTVSGSGTSTVTIATSGSTPLGTSSITFAGTSGALTHTTGATLTVGDFTISAAPPDRTITTGSNTTYTVTVAGSSGFTGNIALAATGLPAGATASFDPATITGGTGTSTLTVSTTSATPGGITSTISIGGTSGTLSHSTSVTLTTLTPDFTISATPASRTVAPGSTTTYTVTLSAVNGFAGNVALSVAGLPSGASGNFAPPSITGGSGSSTLTVTTGALTPQGSATLIISGTAGTLSHATGAALQVAAPGSLGGAVAVPATTQDLNALGTLDWAHWGLTTATSYDHKASVTPQIGNFTLVGNNTPLRYTDHPFGFTWTGGTPTATATASATGIYTWGINNGFRLTVPADTTQRTLTLFVGVWSAQGKLIAHLSDNSAPDYTDTSIVSASTSAAGMYTLTYKAASANQTLTLTFTQNNSTGGNVTLQAAALRAAGPDFTVSVAPATQSIAQGTSATYTVTIAALEGFTSSVALAATGLPAGATASFNPPTISGSGASTATITTSGSTPLGASSITFTGTSGALTHNAGASLTVVVPDFTISAAPASRTVTAGGNTNYTVTVSPVNGFAGTVALTATGLPAGATASFNPSTISGSGTSTATITTSGSTPAGDSAISITGTSGSLSHSTSVTLTTVVPDFSIAVTPSSRTVAPGGNTTYTVTVSPLNGFTGNVALSVTGLPSGASGTFAPTSITGSGSSTLTVTAGALTPPGSSPLTINAVSGILTHTTTATFVVSGGAPVLSAVLATPATTQNLTNLGTLDWAHWGLTTATSYDHKASVTPQISNFTLVGNNTPLRYTDHPFGFTWTGGTPTATATASATGIYTWGINNGFRLTVPADTTQRTLTLFVGVWSAQGKLVAHLSDNSAPDYTDTSIVSASTTAAGMYTLTYRAASANQTLTLTFTQNNSTGGNVTLQAAALGN